VEHLHAGVSPNPTVDTLGLVFSAPQTVLGRIKDETGLTWGQIANAMDVEVRTLHLWRTGGGISAAHEARLYDLDFLVQSVRLHEPNDARGELVSARSGQSLLDRFRHGAAGHELALAVPWRVDAREALSRNVAARANGEPVDEEFGFLLYTTDPAARAFSAYASALLDDPSTSRQVWESEIDRQFADTEQPPLVEAAQTSDAYPIDANGEADRPRVSPLFDLNDLGITLGVGAIASRPAVGREP
jgi:hypothetical protein